MQRVAPYLFVVLAILLGVGPQAEGDDEQGVRLLDVESIGIPAAPGIEPRGREINDLFHFDGKLWVGCGDATDNTGPTPIYAVDPATGATTTTFSVDDEGIYAFRTLGGKLAVPGYDATESWDFGNLYVREGTSWKKLRTLPHAIHVQDVCEFGGAWFAAIGASVEFAGKQTLAMGTIQFSTNAGKSWRTGWCSPGDPMSVWRVGALLPFGGKLYAFPFAVGVRPPAKVPEAFRAGIGKPMQGMAYLYRADPLGAVDAIRYDGMSWQAVDLVPTKHLARVRPFLFGDRILISALHGEYIGSFSTYVVDNRKLPPGMTTALHAFDGESTTRVPLEYDAIRDAVVHGDTLRLLLLRQGEYWIAETKDLKSFRWLALPFARFTANALEYVDGTYWVGTQDGNLFRSVGERSIASIAAVAGSAPGRVLASGDLPRNARAGWLAVTRLTKPWLEARLVGDLEAGKAKVKTANTDAFRVFPPAAALAAGGALTLEVDGATVFADAVPPKRSLVCTRTEAGWTASLSDLDASAYVPKPQVVAQCSAGMDPQALGAWAAKAILAAEGGDRVLLTLGTFKRPLPAGPVTSRVFLDLLYRNRIASFEATGAELEAMLAFSAKAQRHRRVSMFPQMPKLDPGKTYRVHTTDYVSNRAKEFFDRELDARVGERDIHALLLERLVTDGEVGPGAPK